VLLQQPGVPEQHAIGGAEFDEGARLGVGITPACLTWCAGLTQIRRKASIAARSQPLPDPGQAQVRFLSVAASAWVRARS
jgi:hypothetical protein